MTIDEAIKQVEAILPGEPAPDDEIDPRWQAIIEVGQFIESHPEEVWRFIRRWGSHPQDDLRMAIATCLLEHLLDYDFDRMFQRVEDVVREDRLFADTFTSCGKFGDVNLPENSRKFDALRKWCCHR